MSEHTCKNCGGERWVCEDHPAQPWNAEGCQCGAGMPCSWCNPCDEHNPPAFAPDTELIEDFEELADAPMTRH